MRIGELSSRTGVPPRMLRYYEQQGLITPDRSDNGYRDYAESQIDRVQRVRSLIRTGVPTRLISAVLDLEEPDNDWSESCSQEFAETLAHELRTIEEKIACLQTSRGTIRDYLARTGHGSRLQPLAD
jgi:DNA-binding transcriptional MerR regulator